MQEFDQKDLFMHPLAEIKVVGKDERLNSWATASVIVHAVRQGNAVATSNLTKFIVESNPLADSKALVQRVRKGDMVAIREAIAICEHGITKTAHRVTGYDPNP